MALDIYDLIASEYKDEISWLMDVTVSPSTTSSSSSLATAPTSDGLVCISGGVGPYRWEINSPSEAYLEESGGSILNLGKICEPIKVPGLSCSESTIVNITVTDILTGESITIDETIFFDSLEWDTERNPTVVLRSRFLGPNPSSVNIFVKNGSPPFTWEILYGNKFHFLGYDGSELITNERTVKISAYYDQDNQYDSTYSACGSAIIRVTDSCGDSVQGAIRCDFGQWAQCGSSWSGDCLGELINCGVDCSSEYENLEDQGFVLREHEPIFVSGEGWVPEWTWDVDLDLGAWTILHRCCDGQNSGDSTPLSHTYSCTATGKSFTYTCGACNCGRKGDVMEFICPSCDCDDDFDGTDYDPVDQTKWDDHGDFGNMIYLEDNRAKFESMFDNTYMDNLCDFGGQSPLEIVCEFSASIWEDVYNFPDYEFTFSLSSSASTSGGAEFTMVSGIYDEQEEEAWLGANIDGAGIANVTLANSYPPIPDRDFKLRLIRQSGDIHFDYDVGSGWVRLATASGSFDAFDTVRLHFYGYGYYLFADNFKVLQGCI